MIPVADPRGSADRPRTLFDLFGRTAGSDPGRSAIEHRGVVLTYGQLLERAEAVSAALSDRGVEPGRRIALFATREIWTYAAYLGILRSGCAVVPIGSDVNRRRTSSILSAAEVSLSVGVAPTASTRSHDAVPCIDPAETDRAALGELRPPQAADIAYVIFTSGSTGAPKGVPISHRSALSYIEHAVVSHSVTAESRLSHAFELTFDPSIFDMFCAWAAGATIVIPDPIEAMLPVTYVNQRNISHWFSVPSVVSVASHFGNLPPGSMPSLVHSQFCGEQLTLEQARSWRAAAPESAIVNSYGPTELTVTCSEYKLPAAIEAWPTTANRTVPIGEVYPHLEYVVVDDRGLTAEQGELCIRGPQRFDGYLDPSDNNGRFMAFEGGRAVTVAEQTPDPDHWYRTGDRVRVEAGALVHLDRLDRQVKVRGYRIELGEIETALRDHPRINSAAVEVVDLGHSGGLCAILTGSSTPESEIQAHLAQRLQSYMLPDRYCWVDELPLTGNGKVDHGHARKIAQEQAERGFQP